ncbi:MAG: peptidyl-tRNA hydrolase [Bacteroidetes bacterium]|uniref:aminoacyl-tRNA hydrolase n=1 Tax=unclassified Chitinophaga TaxID=2619133 RepID=UPI0009CF69F4|nr:MULTISPECIES: aminoacyl-tRNA hydrolase [unclassified Chitinophaga]MBP1651861.1 peptidyl-tRNA hydrolase [Bacteroidota bacterium]OMP80650.1 aminoacyl-tRNA hydrolase [[Flexibacter] sp. ATCC 35208]WPV69439.1 aminoacyl-tRNA hydrolase [Chitinophaga sp. LS1]
MKYLIVGLGNIGAEYEHTRHNIGFDIADTFVAKHGATYKSERLADVAEVKWKGRTLIVIKPTTYMNLSGKAVKYWMDKEKVPLENIFVLVDDLALPVEVLRIRPGGSDAGQNGLKNIQELLGTNQYPRLRFGIGNDYPKGRQVDFVLGKWPKDEMVIVQWKLEKCVEIIEGFVSIGLERTMNKYNNLKYSPGN